MKIKHHRNELSFAKVLAIGHTFHFWFLLKDRTFILNLSVQLCCVNNSYLMVYFFFAIVYAIIRNNV